MMVQLAPPQPQGGQLADHIGATPGRLNANRFQPLTLEKVSFWENVAHTCSPPAACQPSQAEADFPSLLKPPVRISPSAHLSQEGMSKVICKGEDTLVGNGGPSVKDAICKPVLKPVVPNSKIDKQRFFMDLRNSCGKLGHV